MSTHFISVEQFWANPTHDSFNPSPLHLQSKVIISEVGGAAVHFNAARENSRTCIGEELEALVVIDKCNTREAVDKPEHQERIEPRGIGLQLRRGEIAIVVKLVVGGPELAQGVGELANYLLQVRQVHSVEPRGFA